jgi:maleylpyruvate isomerase
MKNLKLYHYWRSTSSWRVRWALNIKNLDYSLEAVNLLKGEQKSKDHLQRNPLALVPVLKVEDETVHYLAESTAIIEWLEECFPEPSLIFGDSYHKAYIRQLTQVINASTQPLQNLATQKLHSDDADKKLAWAQHWIRNGLAAYEKLARQSAGKYSVLDQVSMADLCLIPQCYNAIRFKVGLEDFPTIQKIHDACLATNACHKAHPDQFAPEG